MLMRTLPLLCLFALAAPAQAEWHKASTRHFVIYADERPDRLEDFAVKLERFDQAARALRNMPDLPESQGNRVTIFVLKDEKAVQTLAGDKSGWLSGFYRPSAEGSVAFVPKRIDGQESADEVNLVFLHEYAHHLMMQELSTPYPEWLVEGFAEFMSAAKFERDGTVGLGLSAKHRAYGLQEGPRLPIEALLSGKYEIKTVGERESVYGRGWLMTHFFVFEPSRKGQLRTYLAGIARGDDPLEAARTAFGDLKVLERDLDRYMRKSTINYWRIPAGLLKAPAVAVTKMTAGEVAIMPYLVQQRNNDGRETTEKLIAPIRAVAAQHAGDPLVEITLAHAELTMENAAAAEKAAARALKTDPKSTDAMLLKGRAMMKRAQDADPFDPKAFEPARNWFINANKLDPEDPEPLMQFYYSYLYAGERPNANAIAALHYASDLAPQDLGLRINSAMQYLRDKKLKEARLALAPIAFSPHGGGTATMARKMITRIDAGDADGAEKAASE